MSEVKKCPKCGGEMKNGYVRGAGGQLNPVHFVDRISFWRGAHSIESTSAFACKNCGYIELYVERKE